MLSNVNRIGFGAMQLPGPGVWGPPADREAALAVLRRAVELGVDHVDTAQYYGPDVANELIRTALHPYPADLTIVTKVGARRDDKGAWVPAGRPEQLREGVEDNLRALGLERMAAVNLRLDDGSGALDEGIPLEEQLGALSDLREEGKLAAIGLSSATVEQLEQAAALVDVACVQNRYGLLDRAHEPELRWCAERGIPFVPFFPLGSAFGLSPVREHPVVLDVAGRLEATAAQVVLAWLLQHDERILLIPGTSSLAHLEENVAAGELELAAEDVAVLDGLYAEAEADAGSGAEAGGH
jgi:aryl-alcohol dehydrogenase-like predicted oxidoreductase